MPDALIGKLEEEAAWSEIGPTAALVVAMAAGVVSEAARQSTDSWDGAAGVSAQAAALRRRAIRLAREDLEAHRIASEALGAAVVGDRGRARGEAPLATALAKAADLPLEIAEVAADVAVLAALAAEHGRPDRRADAAGAAMLGAGAVAAAEHLIDVNLATTSDDERLARARELCVTADAASDRGRAASA